MSYDQWKKRLNLALWTNTMNREEERKKTEANAKLMINKHLSPTHVLAVWHDGNHFNSNVPDLAMIRGVLRWTKIFSCESPQLFLHPLHPPDWRCHSRWSTCLYDTLTAPKNAKRTSPCQHLNIIDLQNRGILEKFKLYPSMLAPIIMFFLKTTGLSYQIN